MHSKNQVFKTARNMVVTVFLTLGLSISFQSLLADWEAPLASPPTQTNIAAPINEGSATQTKTGGLAVGQNLVIDGTELKFSNTSMTSFFVNSHAGIQLRLDSNNTDDNSEFGINDGTATNGTRLFTLREDGRAIFGAGTPSSDLKLDVEGKVGATEYCDNSGGNCKAITAMGGGIPSGYMIAGTTATAPSGFTYVGRTDNESWATKVPMPVKKIYPIVAACNSKIYVIGGRAISGTGGTILGGGSAYTTNNVDEYNPVTDSWSVKTNMLTPRWGMMSGVVGTKIYAIGGGGGLTKNEAFDCVAYSWAPKADMPTGRYIGASAVVNGKIYVMGGYNSVTSSYPVKNEVYTPDSGWGTETDIPLANTNFSASAIGKYIYAIGGSTWLNVVKRYDTENRTWLDMTNMPTARRNLTTAVVNGKIYAIGGYKGGTAAADLVSSNNNLNTNEEYDPASGATGTWTSKAPMPTPRRDMVADVVGGKIYVIGGWDGANYFNTNEMYDPAEYYFFRKD